MSQISTLNDINEYKIKPLTVKTDNGKMLHNPY